jgi:hypothetical protein
VVDGPTPTPNPTSVATPTPDPLRPTILGRTPSSTPRPPTPSPGPEPTTTTSTTGNFQVILADLAAAATAFHTGAEAFSHSLASGLRHSTVDSGDAGLDRTVHTALTIIDEMHRQLVGRLEETGTNLAKAHDSYERSGVRARELYDNLMHAEPAGAH